MGKLRLITFITILLTATVRAEIVADDAAAGMT